MITEGESFTPNLDRLAEDGVLYKNAIAPGPSTYESMPSIWTGKLMGENDTIEDTELRKIGEWKEMHLRSTTFPEHLQKMDYELGAFTANPHTSRGWGFERGFDEYEDFVGDDTHPFWRWMGQRPLLRKIKHLIKVMDRSRAAMPWTSYRDDIQSWLDDASDPYFLWVFVLEPHTPYLPFPENRRSTWFKMVLANMKYWTGNDGPFNPDPELMLELYEDAVRDADDFLGWLSESVSTDASLIIHSDHGEGFGSLDHGEWGHKGTLYEENIHVPLVVTNVDGKETISSPISLRAIYDIILDLAKGRYDPKEVVSDYTLSRTFQPNQLVFRTNRRKYWKTMIDDGSFTEEYKIIKNHDRKIDEKSKFSKFAEKVTRNRLNHEREMRTIKSAVREFEEADF